jgi:hypothetical protein
MPEHFQSRLTLVIRKRATKCAEDGFNRDSELYERAADEIELLRAERDEARRLFCKCHAQAEAIGYAEGRGWDCFKEAGK